MKFSNSYIKTCIVSAAMLSMLAVACKKNGNPNHLPSVNASDYEGKIDGFNSSDEVYPNNLIAYWPFDDTKNEKLTGTAPSRDLNNAIADGGIRGKALNLAAGYLHFARQFANFKTDTLKNWTLSAWVKIKNNGSKKTMVFQLARPGIFNGNVNFVLNTNSYPASNDSVLRIQPTFSTASGGTQDNLNNVLDKTNLNNWVHIVLTYDFNTGVFNNWMNGVKVGNFPNRGTGNNSFKSYEPSEVLIGANYNASGIPVSADANFVAMTGMVDEVRLYNKPLPDAFIKALYKLGLAHK